MTRAFAIVVVGVVIFAQLAVASAQTEQISDGQSTLESASVSENLPSLPSAPQGKSTVLGGTIMSVDQVRDELTLKIVGQRPTKILFDERTQVFRDGRKIPLRDLTSDDHASVETLLDGTRVFALSIHILSLSPQGSFQGRILNYNPETRKLTVSAVRFPDSVKFLLPINTPVVRKGQSQFSSVPSGVSDLVKDALVSVTFQSGKEGRSVVRKITILAIPGSVFVFAGKLSSLDMHTSSFVLIDPRDVKSYQISFDPTRLPASQDLHEGADIRVVATYDGARYVATALTVK